MKYNAEITGWGEEAFYFLQDKDMNFLILFNEDAPPELKEISVLHTKASMLQEFAVDDTVVICDKIFTITAIGNEALHTFREMGHCTLSFNGGSEVDRPGCIAVEGDELLESDIFQGGKIEVY